MLAGCTRRTVPTRTFPGDGNFLDYRGAEPARYVRLRPESNPRIGTSWPILATSPPGIALEVVIEVIVSASQPLPKTRGDVRRQEQRTPALRLADMGLLVVAAAVEAVGVPADD